MQIEQDPFKRFCAPFEKKSLTKILKVAEESGYVVTDDVRTNKEQLLTVLFRQHQMTPDKLAGFAEAMEVPNPDAGAVKPKVKPAASPVVSSDKTHEVRAIYAHYRGGHYWKAGKHLVNSKDFDTKAWKAVMGDKALKVKAL